MAAISALENFHVENDEHEADSRQPNKRRKREEAELEEGGEW